MRSDDLAAALLRQRVVRGDRALAASLAAAGELMRLTPGQVLMRQEEDGNAIFFLVKGSVRVLVNGRAVAWREAGETVGEMAAIDPRALRAATVVSQENTIALRLSEPQIVSIGAHFPSLWRHLAAEMAERLRESNRVIRSPNPRPVILIRGGSASLHEVLSESLGGAGLLTRPWPEDAAPESWYGPVSEADFGVLVCAGPDEQGALWLGFCAGILGRGRAFVLTDPDDERAWPCAERLPWDPETDTQALGPALALAAAAADLGPR